jgi:lipopolysaccharide export system protein LptA
MMKFISTLLFAITLPFLATAQGFPGTGGDKNQPIEITADELEILQPNRKAEFRGNVVAVQGNVTIKSQIMKVYYRTAAERSANLGAVSKIEVERNVHLQTPEESARASRGIYQVDQGQILLVGDVILARGQNVLKGNRLDYDLNTQKSLLTSGDTGGSTPQKGGRVKGVFMPGSQTP